MEVQETDVLICGSGSAGLCAAVWLARMGIDFIMIEKRYGPLRIGQADGIQCRTVEVFESFGLAEELTKHAYWVTEVCFWSRGEKSESESESQSIVRTGRTADLMPGVSWQPHIILNQARLNELLLNDILELTGGSKEASKIKYGVAAKAIEVDSAAARNPDAYAITVTAEDQQGKEMVFKAKYALGCDGAHSTIRRSLGYKMVGDTSDSVWGVMDIFPRTNFPDIRKKATIKAAAGNLLIIPREGGSMVRFYIELPPGTDAKNVKLEDLQRAARQIFSQYELEIVETYWWSAYAIGQRLADHFSKDNRVFLTGDACHTHSPKAGQGMNLSLQDGYNIGWKLAYVLKGMISPEILKTYNLEREKTAADLIEFDREFTRRFSSKADKEETDSAQKFSEYFVKSGRYTAGLTTTYEDSMITNAKESCSAHATNIIVGMRFPSAQVVRFCDARALQLVRVLQSTGKWRLMVFAGDLTNPESASRLHRLTEALSSSPDHSRFFLESNGVEPVVDLVLVLHGDRTRIEEDKIKIPEIFTPINGKWRMRDLYRIYVDDESYNYGHGQAYKTLGVDVAKGALVVVRPDQYVSLVTSLDNYAGVVGFFKAFLK